MQTTVIQAFRNRENSVEILAVKRFRQSGFNPLIALIFFVIYLYRLYNKNISTIQQNLEELRELEEK